MTLTPYSTRLTEAELKAITGFLVNRVTGTVWNLYVKDAALVVEVPPLQFSTDSP